MKNLLKISILTAAIGFGSDLNAQNDIKSAAAATATQLEAPATPAAAAQEPAKTTKQEPAKTTKQEPAKPTASPAPAPAKGTASKTEKADTASGGGTRMAISEQGLPKKKKSANSTTAPPATPPKK